MISLLSPGKAPLDLAGASRSTVVIRRNHRRLARMSFSCSRYDLAGYTQSNFAKALEAFRSAISFRRLLVLHDRERNNHRSWKSWVSRPQTRKAESKCWM